MITLQEYAWISDLVYNSVRSDTNNLKVLDGWTQSAFVKEGTNTKSFSGGIYKKGNEVVVAFTGTTPGIEDWTEGNAPAASAVFPSEQVLDAIDLALKAIKENPGCTISFTGHSLGGGLASLMSVFFDKQATVFDEAPFENTAQTASMVLFYATYMRSKPDFSGYPLEFEKYCDSLGISNWKEIDVTSAKLIVLDAYRVAILGGSRPPLIDSTTLKLYLADANKVDIFSSREKNVINYYLNGEILEAVRKVFPAICGVEYEKNIGNQTASSVNLHLMPLFNAVLRSDEFSDAVTKHSFAAEIFYDESLYGFNYNDVKLDQTNILLKFLQKDREKNGWLKVIASDMNKIVDDVTTKDDNIVKGALSLLSEYWYFNNDVNKTAFSSCQGGFSIDLTKFDASSDKKGLNVFIKNLKEDINSKWKSGLFQMLESKPIWNDGVYDTIQNYIIGNYGQKLIIEKQNIKGANNFIWAYETESASVTTDDGNDIIVGSSKGSNNLDGGIGNDTLVSLSYQNSTLKGGDGDDFLYAFMGNNLLEGGNNNDTIEAGIGNDTLDGGEGNDSLNGFYGNDVLLGGGGR